MAQIHKIGDLKICTQALIILVTGIVLAVISLILQPSAAPAVLMMLIVVMVSAYMVNCTVVGDCEIFGWILSVFYVLNLIIGMYVYGNSTRFTEEIKNMVLKTLDESKGLAENIVSDVVKTGKNVTKTVQKTLKL